MMVKSQGAENSGMFGEIADKESERRIVFAGSQIQRPSEPSVYTVGLYASFESQCVYLHSKENEVLRMIVRDDTINSCLVDTFYCYCYY